MTAYNAIVAGEVQDLGYRNLIRERGQALELRGLVYNSRNGSVRIAAKPSEYSSQSDVTEFFQEIPTIGESIGADIEDYEYEEIEGDPYLPYPFVKAPTDDLSKIRQKLDEGIEAIREVGSITEDNNEVLKDVRSVTEDNNEALNAVKDDTEAIKNNTEAITDLAEGQTEMVNLLEQVAASLDTLAGEEKD